MTKVKKKKFISPNDILQAAKDVMLHGADPEGREDWIKIVNFFSANIHVSTQPEAILLLRTMFDIPLTDYEIISISSVQCVDRVRRN